MNNIIIKPINNDDILIIIPLLMKLKKDYGEGMRTGVQNLAAKLSASSVMETRAAPLPNCFGHLMLLCWLMINTNLVSAAII